MALSTYQLLPETGDGMTRLLALAFVLAMALGCATEADQAQWNEAIKDLRGDNMKMRTANWGRSDNADDPTPAPPSHSRSTQN
jgi:hypothetical protein